MLFLLHVGLEQCEVWGVKSAVWSVKCEGISGKWEVWSVKFKFGVQSAQCEIWSVKCEVWSVKEAVGSEKCEVWSVECEVSSLVCEKCSVEYEDFTSSLAEKLNGCWGKDTVGIGCLWTIVHLCLGISAAGLPGWVYIIFWFGNILHNTTAFDLEIYFILRRCVLFRYLNF